MLHRFGSEDHFLKVSPELVHVVAEALQLLCDAKPRKVEAWAECPPILVFTDGAVEEGLQLVTHGAILVDPWKQCSRFFGDHIPPDFVKLWTRSGKKQVIAQAEIFPVVIAKCTWQDMLRHRSVLWFLDNESARMALVRNFSAVLDSYFLLLINSRVDMQVQSRNWFSRVPSKSNPSDSASRLQFSEYKNATQCSPVYDLALQALDESWKLLKMLEMGR